MAKSPYSGSTAGSYASGSYANAQPTYTTGLGIQPQAPAAVPSQGGLVATTESGYRSDRHLPTATNKNGLLDPMDRVYVGTLETGDMYKQGIGAGAGLTQYGVGLMGHAAGQTSADRNAALAYSGTGSQIGASGLIGQNAAVANARGIAARPTDSQALAQLRSAQDANNRAMMGMASAARGGNQAAALRNAQQVGAQSQLMANQQAAQLRAAEQQAAVQRQLGVEQMAAGVGGQQANLGYGMYGQGLGLAQGSTGQLGQLGSQAGGLGTTQQGIYVNAQGERDIAQAEMDLEREKDKRAINDKVFGGVMGSVGGFLNGLGGGGLF
jgi:hypothetical protein